MKTAIEYLRMLQALLPLGHAWNREEDSGMTQVLYGGSEEFSRVDGRSEDLLEERSTITTTELITDHEYDLGIPDECSGGTGPISARRNEARLKLITAGRQNPQFYIDICAILGYTIEITEGPAGTFQWNVTWTNTDVIFFRSGLNICGDPLRYTGGYSLLECILNKYKPAHTVLDIYVQGDEFDYAFSKAFATLYDGSSLYLEGAFRKDFNLEFDIQRGGSFEKDALDDAFDKSI